MYRKKPPVKISEESQSDLEAIKGNELSILCGKNNSGKSFILKQLVRELGAKSSYLGPNRYQNFNLLSNVSPRNPDPDRKYNDFIYQLTASEVNLDNSPLNLQEAIAELTNEQRSKLFEIIENLLGSKMVILHTIADNDMAQKYIDVDGNNISYTSSGLRLITSIVASLLDKNYENFLIDEPELGISPEIQGAIAGFLYNKENREKYFPHIKKLIIATHSPIFLDKSEISNNYIISKENNEFSIHRIGTVQEINSLQFYLLGNRFETLFLPSAIIFVEGKTDHKFIKKLIQIKFPKSQVSISHTNGDGMIKQSVNMLKNMLVDINKSPYFDRTFIILDEKNATSLRSDLVGMGLKDENVITWEKNGIEYYYPERILKEIYNGSADILIVDDFVSANGIKHKKDELANLVSEKIIDSETFNEEFEEKFISKLNKVLF